MIFKLKNLCFVLFVLLFDNIYCQNTKINTVFDIKGIPFLCFYSRDGLPDSIIYKKHDGKRINVSCDIEFTGGWQSLDLFCDSIYYNRKEYNNQEINTYFQFAILFDKNLRIQDISIYKGISNYAGNYNYNEMVKKILFKTAGKWKLDATHTHDWHLYIGSHRFM